MPTLTAQEVQLLQQRRQRVAAANAARDPTRVASQQRNVPAKLEEIIHPLFDTEAFLANSGTINFFARPRGQAAVAGNIKTTRDTNMDVAGQLPNPRVMTVTGIRVVISQISSDAAAAPAITYPTMSTALAAFRAIAGETIFKFFVGTKNYLTVPTVLVPGNVGVSLTGQSVAEAGVTEASDWAYTFFLQGDYFSLMPTRVKIPSLQGFGASVEFPRTAQNAVAAAGNKVTVILDGIQGREIQ